MNPLVGASLVSGIASLLGNQQDYANSQEGMRQQHEYQKEMLQLNTEAQKNLFQYQFDANNAYNDPSAQYARLVKAGLNPNLLYSGGSVSSGISNNSMPSVNSASSVGLPSYDHNSRAAQALGQAFRDYLDSKRVENESKRTDVDTAKTHQEYLSELLRYSRELDKDTPEWLSVQNQIKKTMAEIEKLGQETKTEEKRTEEAGIRVDIAKFEREAATFLPEKQVKEIASIVQGIAESKSREAANYSVVKLNNQLAQESREKQVKLRVETASIVVDTMFNLSSYDERLKDITLKNIQSALTNQKLQFDNAHQAITWLTDEAVKAGAISQSLSQSYKNFLEANSSIIKNILGI